MNHSFIASSLNKAECMKCKRDEISHTMYAQCEACPNKGICEIFAPTNTLLCMGCFTKESIAFKNAKVNPAPVESVRANTPVLPHVKENTNAIDRLAQKLDATDGLEKGLDYFNAKTTQITDIEQKYLADESIPADKRYYEFAKYITSQHNNLRTLLFEAIEVQLQIMSEQRAYTVYLNTIANKLRLEERNELKVKDINYEPKNAPTTVKKIKQSPLERLAEQYAKTLGVPLETAKQMVLNITKENKAECSCAATPGLCKAHPAT